MNRLRSLFASKKKVVINPRDDFRLLDYFSHDLKVLESVSPYQQQFLRPVRDEIRTKLSTASSFTDKVKLIDHHLQRSIDQAIENGKVKTLETFPAPTSSSAVVPKKKSGLLSFMSKPPSLADSMPSVPIGRPLLPYTDMQIILRLQLAKEYFAALQVSLDRAEVSKETLSRNDKVISLLDVVLLGTASERIRGNAYQLYIVRKCMHLTLNCFT